MNPESALANCHILYECFGRVFDEGQKMGFVFHAE